MSLNKKSSLWIAFKNEFKLENLSLNFEKNSEFQQKKPEEILEYFHSAIWPFCNRLIYLVYRLGIAFYYTIWFIESIVRNAEYRAKNFKITNKLKTNIFSLHPWPVYMTSWSLTVLFIHLWVSAFIVLYFYSINQKSCLAPLFSQLFGPFSCSKQLSIRNQHDLNNSCFAKLTKFFSNSTGNQIDAEKVSFRTNHVKSNMIAQSPGVCFNLLTLNNQQLTITNENYLIEKSVHFNNLNQKKNDLNQDFVSDSELENINNNNNNTNNNMNTSTIINLNNLNTSITATININNNNTNINYIKTYCDNQSKCYIPSSTVVSDAESWKTWIDSHVPLFILYLIKLSWLLNNLVAISAIVVSVVYFAYVNMFDLEVEPTWVQEIGNVHRHGINSLVAIIDVLLMAYPIRILHFVYVNGYGWIYAIMTFIYWYQNPSENIIYEQIDYKNPLKIFVLYSSLTFVVFLMQIVLFFAYRLKLHLKEKYFNSKFDCLNQNISNEN